MADSASRTSSSLNGLMIAVTNFMVFSLAFVVEKARRCQCRRALGLPAL
jgi:hypothetical protein